jgi:c-di-GMP-binding flagellar brake protein YcgR
MQNNEGVERYRCKVQEVKENEFYVDYPVHIKNGKTTYILNGTQLNVSFVTDEGLAYNFDSEVMGRTKQSIPMIQLSYPGHEQLIKIQRREYVRVESSVDVAVHPDSAEFQPFTSVTHDISAGGSSIMLPKGVTIPESGAIQTNFVINLNNGEIYYLKLKSKVIRIVDGKNGRKRASLQFDDIKEHERQVIIKYSFEQQLLMRKTY